MSYIFKIMFNRFKYSVSSAIIFRVSNRNRIDGSRKLVWKSTYKLWLEINDRFTASHPDDWPPVSECVQNLCHIDPKWEQFSAQPKLKTDLK